MERTWFVDENDLILGRLLAEDHGGVVYPGHPDLPEVLPGTKDDIWLTAIGQLGLLVITRDRRIRYRPVERQRWIDHGVRGFVLTGAGNMRSAEQLALVDGRWNRMVSFVDKHPTGPWMCSVTQSGVNVLIPPPNND